MAVVTAGLNPGRPDAQRLQAGRPMVKHIQETGDSMYVPSSDLTVDEAMVRLTGRSLQTTTIPQKPASTGYKIWVLGQSGYFVRWLWHVHGRGPCGLVPQQCSRQGDEEVAEEHLTPTQRVITTLLTLLPLAVYHVFLDNIFASEKLFKALRSSQVGATGTCRKDSGVDELLVAEKDREGKGIPWGQIHCIPTKDGKVHRFSWKDNALVLFLTTVFREGHQVIRSRRRPAGSSAANRAAREVFGSEVRKDLGVPLGIDEYNHHMNGIDTGDQLRSYNQYSRPIRREGWQSIAWNFLLKVILVNSFLLQICGEPEWKVFESQYQWRRHLSAQLIQRFGSSVQARPLARLRRVSD
ncbi:PiggyBac transposable element-derived protein 4 [Fusarium oxysporum f. sp. raphani]|uniref:PiggyBac transposable element-derived protein 4 n=1 Tax=Fusarium oxysporum f. sp. raphani TaxID=96318 RepID=A0A8J5NT39_FUSOX|nr:PiggyBac transposable element-derived protein 4 [Fusarium oxysporum f. sp. raphani]